MRSTPVPIGPSFFRAVTEHDSEGLLVVDSAGAIFYANPAASELLGRSERDLIGVGVCDLVQPGSRAILAGLLEARGGGAEIRLGTRLVEVGVKNLLDNPEVRGILIEMRDQAKLRAYFESASQGIVAVDASGRIELVNARLEEMFGYQREELLGRELEILLPERLRGVHAAHRAGFFEGPRVRPMGVGLELAGRRKDGTEFPVEIGLGYVPARNGLTAIGFISDITQRKRAEEALRHTQKLESLGVLAGGIAHDFNNLLVGILGNASLALETASEDNRPLLEGVVSATERAADLTRQLLAYTGKGRFVLRWVDLSQMVRQISELLHASIPPRVQLRLELQGDLPHIEADPDQMQQVIMNLVINAAEAIPDGCNGVVELITRVEEDGPSCHVALEVRDTGCGMDEETQARMFDPFFTTKFTGRGLGLAAVQGIVRGHKGALRVHTEPNQGSIFTVRFPAVTVPGPRALEIDPLPSASLAP